MIQIFLWAIIIAILLLFFIFKARHLHNKFYLIFAILFLIFLYISATVVINSNDIDVTSVNGMVTAGKAYFKWVGNVIGNTRNIVGNAINMDWSASN
jgi:hypothetical protein